MKWTMQWNVYYVKFTEIVIKMKVIVFNYFNRFSFVYFVSKWNCYFVSSDCVRLT